MRKTLSFIVVFCLLVCLCGCGANFETTVTVNEPIDNSVNGYKLEQKDTVTSQESTPVVSEEITPIVSEQSESTVSEQSESTVSEPIASTVNITGDNVYYANKSSKKFHLSSCGIGKRIIEENLYKTSDRAELINSGYDPCKKCNP